MLRELANGDVLAAGEFSEIGGVPANNIALWSTAPPGWSPLGDGLDAAVSAVTVLDNGDIVAAGFTTAGGTAADGAARSERDPSSAIGLGILTGVSGHSVPP